MALADSTRRSILAQVSKAEMSISEIAAAYSLTFAAVSKHIMVLQKANLITKRRHGKEQIVIIVPETLELAREQIENYAKLWSDRFDRLEIVLSEMEVKIL